MKDKVINLFFVLSLIGSISACQAQTHASVLDNIIDDYKQQLSIASGPYKFTEYFSNTKEKYKYLVKTFEPSVLYDAINIKSRRVNFSELSDMEGGYELGLLLISYKNSKISKKNFGIISKSPNSNLRGDKVFTGYIAIRCDSDVVIISSTAVVTKKIKNYFTHIKKSNKLCE